MRATERLLTAILTGQVAVAAYDDLGQLVDATGVQLPGVLDDLYHAARRSGRSASTWNGRNADAVGVGADRAGCRPC